MFLGYHLGWGLQTSWGLLVRDQMNLSRYWHLLREHRCHALLSLFSLNCWWWHLLSRVLTKTLSDRTLLGNSWNFNGWILMSPRYLILWLCLHCLRRFRILYWLYISNHLRKLCSFTRILGHPHGPLGDHGRRVAVPRLLHFFPLPLDFLSLSHHLSPLSLFSLFHVSHQLGKGFTFFLELEHCILQQEFLRGVLGDLSGLNNCWGLDSGSYLQFLLHAVH
jgi:hypothetical protein